jgi:hypothetical protein
MTQQRLSTGTRVQPPFLSGSSWAIASLLCLAYVAWYAQLS